MSLSVVYRLLIIAEVCTGDIIVSNASLTTSLILTVGLHVLPACGTPLHMTQDLIPHIY